MGANIAALRYIIAASGRFQIAYNLIWLGKLVHIDVQLSNMYAPTYIATHHTQHHHY